MNLKQNNMEPTSLQTLNDKGLYDFLINSPKDFRENERIRKYQLKNGDYIHCVLWNYHFYITGTDIVKILIWRFQNSGRQIGVIKKFEEGIFSDLRNLKPGVDATLESPRSEFLEFLYKNGCIRTQKKQKVFYWYSVPHDELFFDALERDMRRDSNMYNTNINGNSNNINQIFGKKVNNNIMQNSINPLMQSQINPMMKNASMRNTMLKNQSFKDDQSFLESDLFSEQNSLFTRRKSEPKPNNIPDFRNNRRFNNAYDNSPLGSEFFNQSNTNNCSNAFNNSSFRSSNNSSYRSYNNDNPSSFNNSRSLSDLDMLRKNTYGNSNSTNINNMRNNRHVTLQTSNQYNDKYNDSVNQYNNLYNNNYTSNSYNNMKSFIQDDQVETNNGCAKITVEKSLSFDDFDLGQFDFLKERCKEHYSKKDGVDNMSNNNIVNANNNVGNKSDSCEKILFEDMKDSKIRNISSNIRNLNNDMLGEVRFIGSKDEN